MPVVVEAELIDRILAAQQGAMELPGIASWKSESDRRIADIDAEKIKGAPQEKSLARAHKVGGM